MVRGCCRKIVRNYQRCGICTLRPEERHIDEDEKKGRAKPEARRRLYIDEYGEKNEAEVLRASGVWTFHEDE